MSIELGQIHNVVRTYQRVLNLGPSGSSKQDQSASEPEDRVSISPEARKMQDGVRRVDPGQGPSPSRR